VTGEGGRCPGSRHGCLDPTASWRADRPLRVGSWEGRYGAIYPRRALPRVDEPPHNMALPLLLASLTLAAAPVQTGRGPQPELPVHADVKTPATPRTLPVAPDDEPRPAAASGSARSSRVRTAAASRGVAHGFDRVFVDRPGGEDVWARGRTYKASFGPGGAQYIPFLGPDAPRNHPVRFELESVTVGGEGLPLSLASARASDGAVALDRGAVTERYILGLESIEQTFVLEAPVSGAIDVRVAIKTDLTYDASAPTPRYSCDLGGVAIGEAYAVDARGVRVPLGLSHDASGYTITVPAPVVARAAFPLTIDPIVSTFAIDTFSARLTSPRTAFLDAQDDGLVVYNEDFSATDSDVYSARVDSMGNVQLFGYIDMTAERWWGASVGAAQSSSALLVASIADTGADTNGMIMGRMYDGTAFTLGAPFRIDSPNFPGYKTDLSVGGDPFDRFLVTWQREFSPTDHDVHARVVLADETLVGASNILLDNTSADYTDPECSRHNGNIFFNNSRWGIVAQREVSGVLTLEVAEIVWTGDVAEDFYQVGAFAQDLLFPDISAPLEMVGPKRFMVTAERDFGTDYDIQAFVVEDGAAIAADNLSLGQLPGDPFDEERASCIESNNERFVLVWNDRPAFDSVISTLVLLDGVIHDAEHVVFEPSAQAADTDATVFPPTGNFDTGDYLIVWEDEGGVPEDNIQATIYDDVATPLGSLYCPSTLNSSGVAGRAYITGTGTAGDPHVLHAAHLPANQFGIFVCSETSGLVTPPGSNGPLCLAGDIGRFAAILDTGPSGEFSLPIDTGMLPQPTMFVSAFAGETWQFQAWHRDLGPGGAQASNFTSGTRLTFD